MRVLIVTDGLQPLLCLNAVGLADRGHRVTVVGTVAPDELDPVDRFRLGRSIRTYGRDPGGGPWRTGRLLTQVARSAAIDPRGLRFVACTRGRGLGPGQGVLGRMEAYLPVLGRRADVVYFEAANVAADHGAVLDRLGPKLVMCTGSDLRVLPYENARLARELPAVFAWMGRILCRSEDLRQCAVRLGAPAGRTAVLPAAVNTRVFGALHRPPRGDGTLRLVTVGRHHWVKGYEYAVQAIALSRRDGHDVTLAIVAADDDAGQAVRFAVADLGLDDAVRLAGAKSALGVRAALARADAFVVSSVSEGTSRAAMEAMATGLPVITTDVGGMSELVTDGFDGLVVPSRDPRALADAINVLAADGQRRAAMGDAARARAREFDVDRHLDRLEEILYELADL